MTDNAVTLKVVGIAVFFYQDEKILINGVVSLEGKKGHILLELEDSTGVKGIGIVEDTTKRGYLSDLDQHFIYVEPICSKTGKKQSPQYISFSADKNNLAESIDMFRRHLSNKNYLDSIENRKLNGSLSSLIEKHGLLNLTDENIKSSIKYNIHKDVKEVKIIPDFPMSGQIFFDIVEYGGQRFHSIVDNKNDEITEIIF